jgi:uncharacterized protein
MSKKKRDVIISPCVGICALNDDDVCVGCYRTGVEISHWGDMKENERRAILELVKEREKSSYI